jgi:hypothetical protein
MGWGSYSEDNAEATTDPPGGGNEDYGSSGGESGESSSDGGSEGDGGSDGGGKD